MDKQENVPTINFVFTNSYRFNTLHKCLKNYFDVNLSKKKKNPGLCISVNNRLGFNLQNLDELRHMSEHFFTKIVVIQRHIKAFKGLIVISLGSLLEICLL